MILEIFWGETACSMLSAIRVMYMVMAYGNMVCT